MLILNRKIWTLAAKYAKEGRLLDLKKDVTFKAFFGGSSRESAYCRCKMISAVIGRQVLEARVLNPELLPFRHTAKFPVLDLRCRLEDGSEVDVEIQGKYQKDAFVKRSLYYASRLVSENLDSGKNYDKLAHIYQITFMNFTVTDDDRLHHTYTLHEDKSNQQLTDLLQIHFIELPKLKELSEQPRETLSDLAFWAMIVFAGDSPKIKQWLSHFKEHEEELSMASVLLQRLSRNRRDWARYIFADKAERDWNYLRESGIENARKEAREEAMKEGRAEGSRAAKLEAARNLLAMHVLSAEQIAQASGLTLSEVAGLQSTQTAEQK